MKYKGVIQDDHASHHRGSKPKVDPSPFSVVCRWLCAEEMDLDGHCQIMAKHEALMVPSRMGRHKGVGSILCEKTRKEGLGHACKSHCLSEHCALKCGSL